MSISSNYLANSSKDGETQLQSVSISVNSDKALLDKEVQSVVQQILQISNNQDIKSIIIRVEEGRTSYKIDNQAEQVLQL